MATLNSLFPDDLKPEEKQARKQAREGPSQAAGLQKGNAPLAAAGAAGAQRVLVKDLTPGREAVGIYVAQDATLRLAKNGSKYVQATFCDKTGQIAVRQWDATDPDFEAYGRTGFVKAKGRVETYQNRLQMVISKIASADPEGLDPADFLPVSRRDQGEMERELDRLIAGFTDPDYKRLLEALLGSGEVRKRFLRSPAATNLHHAWIGGLLEHVLSACETADAIARQRPFLNRDLLVLGVILHDIGKVEELEAKPGFPYTDTGRLCGHIVLGTLLVDRQIQQLKDFPKVKRDLILHLILSHHGTHEFGSPVTPLTAEAVALHHLECLDAKVQGIQTQIEKDDESGNIGNWTEFARLVEGRIFKGKG